MRTGQGNERGRRQLEQRITELRADGCVCPVTFDRGLSVALDPVCPVHYPPRGGTR